MEEITREKQAAQAKTVVGFMRNSREDPELMQRRFQLQSIKEAVRNKTMSVDKANMILLNLVKNENTSIIKKMKGDKTKQMNNLIEKINK